MKGLYLITFLYFGGSALVCCTSNESLFIESKIIILTSGYISFALFTSINFHRLSFFIDYKFGDVSFRIAHVVL